MKKTILALLILTILVISGCGQEVIIVSEQELEQIEEPQEKQEVVKVEETKDIEELEPVCKCPTDEDPVCGSDGNMYLNSCEAECSKITEYVKGECNLGWEDVQFYACAKSYTSSEWSAQYNPVCGKVVKVRTSESYWKTYGNANTACRASTRTYKIEGYTRGVCNSKNKQEYTELMYRT